MISITLPIFSISKYFYICAVKNVPRSRFPFLKLWISKASLRPIISLSLQIIFHKRKMFPKFKAWLSITNIVILLAPQIFIINKHWIPLTINFFSQLRYLLIYSSWLLSNGGGTYRSLFSSWESRSHNLSWSFPQSSNRRYKNQF